MKIRSLLLGSIAAAGLASGAQAADLGVLTSLDVCDSLGLSGLTISSDTNCLQITGGVSYEFNWGDYRTAVPYAQLPGNPWADNTTANPDFMVKGSSVNGRTGGTESVDYDSKVEAWIRVLAAADSDFGQAKAIIGLRQVERYRMRDGGWAQTDNTVADPLNFGYQGIGLNGDSTAGVELNEAYVSVGDTTVLMAGLRKKGKDGSIGNIDDDVPFNYLGLFGSTATDAGVLFKNGAPFLGGLSIQAVSDLGNGVSVGVGLENIDNRDGNASILGTNAVARKIMDGNSAGTLLGVVNYAGESVTAHLTGGAIGVLDGHIDSWFAHTGATATFDNFKLRAAVAYLGDNTGGINRNYWHGLVSGQATFDMFTLALSGEFKSSDVAGVKTDGYGIGASIGAQVTETVSLNLGGRYFHTNNFILPAPGGAVDRNMWQVEAQIVAALTETLKASAAVGVYGGDVVQASLAPPPLSGNSTAYYGSIGLDWAPGGDFTASIKGQANSEGAYKATFKAAKTFQ
ncbi:hypothetical protein JP74_13400 [Devosia sp. 17-2-E-8]|uniref:hypothetical protein n=1 Tax=Paradevosia shaoguanensis TaxID=1335043 RepID=UPI0005013D86|nr:hypothetical protein [Paradevosia shaoguanensis]KFL26368.1 hypothetical protein JP74_13400 [Devosia sp. 17-2-E-8]